MGTKTKYLVQIFRYEARLNIVMSKSASWRQGNLYRETFWGSISISGRHLGFPVTWLPEVTWLLLVPEVTWLHVTSGTGRSHVTSRSHMTGNPRWRPELEIGSQKPHEHVVNLHNYCCGILWLSYIHDSCELLVNFVVLIIGWSWDRGLAIVDCWFDQCEDHNYWLVVVTGLMTFTCRFRLASSANS